MTNILFDIGLLLVSSALLVFIARLLKQPLIPAYILSGFLISKLGLITNQDVVMTLSELGIAFMLFTVGLEMNIKKLKNFTKVAILGGTLQVLVTGLITFLVLRAIPFGFGMNNITLFYLALVVAFSSTMVVVKLLYEREEVDTLHGKIIIGILLLQDIAAILSISFLTIIEDFSIMIFLVFLVKIMFIALVMIILRYALEPVFKVGAKSEEILLLLSVAVCFVFIFLSQQLGFSIAIGSFLAGLLLANLPYRFEIIARISPIRDFFVAIFFASLGLELTGINLHTTLVLFLVILVLVLIIKPLIIILITSMFGYEKKTSFLSGFSLSQTSEFSLILAFQGLTLGHITKDVFSLIILVTVTTIIITTYLLKFDNKFYALLSKPLSIINKNEGKIGLVRRKDYEVVLFGCNRVGYSILKTLSRMGVSFIVVDYDPDVIELLTRMGIDCIYGDATDPEILSKINIKKVKLFISTVPNSEDNEFLLKKIRELNNKAFVFLTATHLDDALKLYELGADYVIIPHFLGGDYAAVLVEKFSKDLKGLLVERVKHIHELKRRKQMGHEHPIHKNLNHRRS